MSTPRFAAALLILPTLALPTPHARAAPDVSDQPTVQLPEGIIIEAHRGAVPPPARMGGDTEAVMTLQYDSGTPFGAFPDDVGYIGEAVRFTPPAPCRILSFEVYPSSSGTMEFHVWRDDGGHKPDGSPAGDLTGPITTAVTGDTWNTVTLPTPVVIDPPREFYIGQFNATLGVPRIMVDDGLPATDDTRLNLHGDLDSGHPGENRWIIVGALDIGAPDPRILNFMVRAEIDTFDEVTEFRFEDVSDSVGFSSGGRYAWGDYNDDGYEDLLVNGRTLLESSGPPDWTFTDVSGDVGIGGSFNGGLWADYDNDGHLDFYSTAGQGGADTLWRNDGPPDFTFTDVTASAGNPSDSNPTEACGWADYDLDGDVDLYVTGSEDWNDGDPIYFEDYLYRNTGPPDYSFEDVSDAAGIRTGDDFYGRGVAWYDYNKDSYPDVFISNYRLHENLFFESQTDGSFSNIAPAKDMQGPSPSAGAFGHSIGSAWGDMNNDGEMDLFVANLAHSNWLDWSDTSKLYMNQGAPAYDFADILGLTETDRISSTGIYYNETHSDPSLIDYNGDGFLDVFVTCVYRGWKSELYMSNGDPADLHFTIDNYPSGLAVDNGWGAAWCDYDQDGDVDVAIRDSEVGGGFHLNNSNSATRSEIPSWLGVKLVGVDANRAAIGATITLHSASGIQFREVVSGRGTGNGDSFVQYFGLGSDLSVDRLEIFWPAGCGIQTVTAPALNEVHVIVEDCSVISPQLCKGTDITVPLPECSDWDPVTTPYRDPLVALGAGECMYYQAVDLPAVEETILLWKEADDVMVALP